MNVDVDVDVAGVRFILVLPWQPLGHRRQSILASIASIASIAIKTNLNKLKQPKST